MKNFTIILAFMLFATLTTKATIWTVNNNTANNSAAHFTSLQTAIDSASIGDTLYVSGSPLSYGSVNVNKQLVFIGEGYHFIGAGRYKTDVSVFHLTEKNNALDQLISSASGSVFTGIYCQITTDMVVNMNNITITRCNTEIYTRGFTDEPTSNWIIINNIIRTISYSSWSNQVNNSNFHVLNNFILGSTLLNNSNIKNNIYISDGHSSGNSNTLINNIYHGMSTLGLTNSILKNNLSYASGGNNATNFDYNTTNYDTNNVVNQDPKFVSATVSTSPTFDYADDYHLQSSSPAIGAGTNGTDIGIYGGNYPFPSGGDIPLQTSALPAIPQITDLEITNMIIPIDSALHINLKARIRN